VARFRHPHLTRGIVKTAHGAFSVTRGLVEAPEAVGDALGWLRVDDEEPAGAHPLTRGADGPTIHLGHPQSCPWCGQPRVRGVMPSPDGNRHYRCAACGTSFFIHGVPHCDPDGEGLLTAMPKQVDIVVVRHTPDHNS
jgi:hypothetical protein